MPTRRSRSRRSLIVALSVAVVGVILLGGLATVYTDLLWFRELGFTNVFWSQIRVKALLGVVFGVTFAAVLLINLWVVQKVTSPHRLFTLEDQVLERYRATLRPYVKWGVVGIALLFGLFAGSSVTSQWRSWLLFNNGTPFGATDPVFGKDIGFYVFRLPFHRFVFTWAFSSLLVITIVTAAAHYFMGGIRLDARGGRATPQVKAHLSVLAALMVLLKMWGYRLDQFGLLYSPRGRVTGASYTDINAELPALKLLVIVALIVGVLFLVNIRVRGWTIPIAGLALLFLTSILAGGAYPAIVQRVRVTPAERTKEAPFIERNIAASREAFGIDAEHVTSKSYGGTTRLTKALLDRNQQTVENIRLWSPPVLGVAYLQLQRLRNYYEFADVDVDRYPIAGRTRQVMLSPREISQSSLQDNAKSWQNTHLTYTHGYGVVASRVDQATGQGTPSFVVSEIPPKSVPGAPAVADPRIYYGELEETPYVVVRSELEEVDFPVDDNPQGFQSNTYAGRGGIQLSSTFRRLAFAWRNRDANLLLSSSVTKDSRIMFRRSIRSRVQAVAPFLKLDHDPYIVMTKDRLVWVLDAYTTTAMYPYSERINLADASRLTGSANYIRNSVKATVDAIDGTVTLYVSDPEDPIIRTWRKVFPGNFRALDQMPAEVREHVRYPEDLFLTQAYAFRLYHITDPVSFYTREDFWDIPADPAPQSSGEKLEPYYMFMKLPDEKEPEYLLMLPFQPSKRKNLSAWLAARSDPEHYGELRAYVFPKGSNAQGPEQIEAQINQDPAFSRERTLLGQAGSNLVFGNLLTIPIENALLYVQPFYLAATGTNIPEMKFVVVVHGEDVATGKTISQALAALLGQAVAPPGEPPPTQNTVADHIAEALRHYAAAQEALRRGDFATYGREQAAMKAALDRAAQQSGATPSPSPTASPSPG